MNGGYIMLDCTGLDLTKETKQTVTGIYNKVQNAIASGKPVYACNMTWDGTPISPTPVMLIQFDGLVSASYATLRLDVDDDDGITITNYVAS